MIFVTVGAQMPFDRLIRAMDGWARERGRDDVLAQIGPADWTPSHIRWIRFTDPQQYEEHCRAADRIVAHAGTGSLLTALELGKPILVMPRRADLFETRNDHQFATIEQFGKLPGVHVAIDETELPRKLDEMVAAVFQPSIGPYASPRLIETVRRFIAGQ